MGSLFHFFTFSKISTQLSTLKLDRYDRQLRLWGADGQVALEGGSVCVLGGSVLASEVLKNLVLPGVGSVTVVDSALVTKRDLGSNFFVTEAGLGKPRAAALVGALRELNPYNFRGSVWTEDPEWVVSNRLEDLAKFSVVVDTCLRPASCAQLAAYLYERNLPLVVLTSWGFVGRLRLSFPPRVVMNSHPEPAIPDLRLRRPFAELRAVLDSYAGAEDLSHAPFLVLHWRALCEWTEAHGALPGPKDRVALRGRVLELAGGDARAANAAEGLRGALLAALCVDLEVPFAVREVLDAFGSPSDAVDAAVPCLDLLLAALKRYCDENAALPLPGSLPDVSCSTLEYLALQEAYSTRAAADAATVDRYFANLLAEHNRIPPDDRCDRVAALCRHAASLRLVSSPSISDGPAARETMRSVLQSLEGPEDPRAWFPVMCAADKVFDELLRVVGSERLSISADVAAVTDAVQRMEAECDFTSNVVPRDHIDELVRAGGAALHPVCSILAGVASQEVIKLLTRQWTPLSHTWIFDGINGRSALIN